MTDQPDQPTNMQGFVAIESPVRLQAYDRALSVMVAERAEIATAIAHLRSHLKRLDESIAELRRVRLIMADPFRQNAAVDMAIAYTIDAAQDRSEADREMDGVFWDMILHGNLLYMGNGYIALTDEQRKRHNLAPNPSGSKHSIRRKKQRIPAPPATADGLAVLVGRPQDRVGRNERRNRRLLHEFCMRLDHDVTFHELQRRLRLRWINAGKIRVILFDLVREGLIEPIGLVPGNEWHAVVRPRVLPGRALVSVDREAD